MDLGVRDSGFFISVDPGGIGLATASVLAAEGAYVALLGAMLNAPWRWLVSRGIAPSRPVSLVSPAIST